MDFTIPNEYTRRTSNDIFREINKNLGHICDPPVPSFRRNPVINGRKHRLLIASHAVLNP